MTLTAQDPKSWLNTIWQALYIYQEEYLPDGDEKYDDEWNDITTAMAWITEALELNVMEEGK